MTIGELGKTIGGRPLGSLRETFFYNYFSQGAGALSLDPGGEQRACPSHAGERLHVTKGACSDHLQRKFIT